MPSNLLRFNRLTPQRSAFGQGQFTSRIRTNIVPVRGAPWGGWVPDIEPSQLELSDGSQVRGMWDNNGILEPENGFFPLQTSPVDVPLGTGSLPATAANAEAVIGLMQFIPTNTTTPTQLAVTANNSTANGHVYLFSGGAWSVIAYDAAGANELTAEPNEIIDWEYFPHLGTTGTVIFVDNNTTDSAYIYPDASGDYDDIDGISGFAFPGSVTKLNARSIANFTDRIIMINTIETDGGTTRHRTRVRWSAVGTASFSGLGSGSADALVEGEGVKVEPIGRFCALYFEDTVAFLRHRILRTAPFEIDYISRERGLIGTRAMVNLGSGVHFGIFNDGWFFIDDTGQWQEVGIKRAGSAFMHKWLHTFYDSLSWPDRNRTVVEYDERKRIIRVAWPSVDGDGSPDQVWNYLIESDTLWPDNYGASTPTYWGRWENTQSSITWANVSTFRVGPDTPPLSSWQEAQSQGITWGFGADIGQEGIVHGTSNGFVYQHDPVLSFRDGTEFPFQWRSHQVDRGSFSNFSQVDRLYVEYERLGTSPNISASILVDNSSVSGTITPDQGNEGDTETGFIHGNLSGRRIGYEVSGNNPVRLKGFQLHVRDEQTDEVNQ